MKKQMTREEIETMLEKKYRGRVVSIEFPWQYEPWSTSQQRARATISGKIDRISIEVTGKVPEPMVVFVINHTSYKADVDYFIENTKLYGNPH